MAAGGDDDELPSIGLVGDGRGLPATGQFGLPQLLARLHVKGAEAVMIGPPLLGVPMVIGSIEGMPNGPLFTALPNG